MPSRPRFSNALRVQLDQANRPHSPGELISGKVYSRPTEAENEWSSTATAANEGSLEDFNGASEVDLCIVFWGMCKSKIVVKHYKTESRHRARCPLVRIEQYIPVPKAFLTSGKAWEKSFTLTIPSEVQTDLKKFRDLSHQGNGLISDHWTFPDAFTKPGAGFHSTASSDAHCLPPTIEIAPRGYERKGEARVSYIVAAILLPRGAPFQRTGQSYYLSEMGACPVWLTRKSLDADEYSKLRVREGRVTEIPDISWSSKDFFYDASATGQRQSKVSRIFRSSVTPIARYNLSFAISPVVMVGDDLILEIKVDPADPQRDDHAPATASPVCLRRLDIDLIAHTGVRSSSNVHDDWNDTLLSHSFDLSHTWTAQEISPSDNHQSAMGAWVERRFAVPRATLPTFKTSNLCRRYLVNWKAMLECGGKVQSRPGSTSVRIVSTPASADANGSWNAPYEMKEQSAWSFAGEIAVEGAGKGLDFAIQQLFN